MSARAGEGLRAVLVEDERLQRVELRGMLVAEGVAVVGEAATVEEAIEAINTLRPDVIFLDIQLGRASGFDVLERTASSSDVIFVTAYDAWAVRAFEVNAVDYLLKPVRAERLADALRRLNDASPPDVPDKNVSLAPDDRLFVQLRDGWRFLPVRTIVAIEAAGDYTRLRTADGGSVMMGRPLREWESRLPAALFARIHRSTIVNLEHVERVEESSGSAFLVHVSGVTPPYGMSRRYAARLRQ